MQKDAAPRRTQFSSCDECRRSRWIGNIGRHLSDSVRESRRRQHHSASAAASNKTRQDDDYPKASEPVETTQQSIGHRAWVAAEDRSPNEARLLTVADPTILTGSPLDVLNPSDAQLLQAVYQTGFDTIFGSWMSSYGCPFLWVQAGAPVLSHPLVPDIS
ncbi:hypothetical protein EYZ11_005480 [Aspergillus tanneri]|uniref:Uncharacterized protein n=1 Tax=Aspergillus tanneri TaxID=1220188 RepID=A0A4S3JI76_9EURO|nr:hypothetical protein EYZ11_005480 [Aspergillus tanneri]